MATFAGVKVHRAAAFEVPFESQTKIALDTVSLGDNTMWSAGAPTKLIAKRTTYHRILCSLGLQEDLESNEFYLAVFVNNVERRVLRYSQGGTDWPIEGFSCVEPLNANDEVEFAIYHSRAGGGTATLWTGSNVTFLAMYELDAPHLQGAFEGAKLIKTSNQLISFSTPVSVSFQAAAYDTDSFRNGNLFEIPAGMAGTYALGFRDSYAQDMADSWRWAALYDAAFPTGSAILQQGESAEQGHWPHRYGITLADLAVGDVVNMRVEQRETSAAALWGTASGIGTMMWLQRLGESVA